MLLCFLFIYIILCNTGVIDTCLLKATCYDWPLISSYICSYCLSSFHYAVWSLVCGLCGARGLCRISPPRFLAESRKRRLYQGSFVSAVFLVVYFLWFVLCLCVYFLWFIFSIFLIVCLSVTVNWLAVKTASEMTYTVSGGALNSTQLNSVVCQQLMFIRTYLDVDSTSKGLVNGDGKTSRAAGDCAEDQTITEEVILFEANAYALASHFLWGLWSIIQSHISTIRFAYLVCTSFCCRFILLVLTILAVV